MLCTYNTMLQSNPGALGWLHYLLSSNLTEPARCPEMGESEGKQGAAFPSEASRMLEAALEQMDGIIQGAKYELPHYFDNFSIQVLHHPLTFTSEQFPTKDSPQQSEVGEAVKRLREAIQEGGNRGPQAQVSFVHFETFKIKVMIVGRWST